MTKKDLFRIIIKLFGLYVAIGAFAALPGVFTAFLYGFDPVYGLILLGSVLVALLILFLLLIKTDAIIRMFKLDTGFDDDKLDGAQFSSESIIKLAILLIALFLILDSFPEIVTNLFYLFKNSIPQNNMDGLLDLYRPVQADYYVLTNCSIRLVVGVLLVMYKSKLANRIERFS